MCKDIIIENKHFRLAVGCDCICKSLVHKKSGQECLAWMEETALFSVTEPRPYNNEVKLARMNKRTTFQANQLRREGNRLIVGFEFIPYEAVVEINEADDYVSFRLAEFLVDPEDFDYLSISDPPVESFRILQIPVKKRVNFGHWLNVSFDDEVAVNVLATVPHTIIDAETHANHHLMTADALRDVRLIGTEVALVVTETDQLLDIIDQIEQDYNLPRGVQSRRSRECTLSIYAAGSISPENVDQHIKYCKQCGFQMMRINCASLFGGRYYSGCGNFKFIPQFPNGIASLREVLTKIKAAGIIPGIHFLHSHIGFATKYISPVADHRLNLVRHFTLSKNLSVNDTTIFVEQNPENSTMAENCRILQFGGELISYERFTTTYPYCFTGCQRGHLNTNIVEHPVGQIGGLLDVSEFCGSSCHIDQNSSLQDEIAEKLAELYHEGFEFIYFDGAEGTHEPFAYHIPNAMFRVYKHLNPSPLFAEGAAKVHFNWHILSGGNAFDPFAPDIFKDMIRKHPVKEAPHIQNDFSRINFGWWSTTDMNLQPDHWEFGMSMATSWNCPVSIYANVPFFDTHPRANDLLEVLRRWEDVRVNKLLSENQRKELRDNPDQEHILLVNENKEYELVPYTQIPCKDETIRAFKFTRKDRNYIVYWHASGNGWIHMELDDISVQEELYLDPITLGKDKRIPVGNRRYISSNTNMETLVNAISNASFEPV